MAEIRHLENRHDVIFFCRGWSDLDKFSQTYRMTCRLRWCVEMETRCRIPIWWTFARIQWHVIPEPRITLQGNVEAFCHKHFVVFSRNQHRRLLPAMCHKIAVRWPCSTGDSFDNTWLVAPLTAGTKARYSLRIAISAYPTCIRRPR